MSEQLCLFEHLPANAFERCPLNSLFSGFYAGDVVSCVQQLNSKATPVALTTDEATNPNVRTHAEAGSTSILTYRLGRKQGCVMDSRQAKGFALAANAEIVREGN